MKKIHQLNAHLANLIAAGEVVERPASVVKELLENSIDAGAKSITAEIKAGGMTYIRVTDNGSGMSPEDAQTAFLRHATSKLSDASGLEAIGTLGFRGEALAAIAAVSHIELLTREPGATEGFSVTLKAGTITEAMPAGCPEGTTIIIRDLFYNTPARQKFMKTDRAESSAVSNTVLKTALSVPEISVRYIKDGKTEYLTAGDSKIDSCIYSLLGREFTSGLIPATLSDDAVSVKGYISKPSAARGNRSYQFFFVNGRPIQSKIMQAALEQVYANTLPTGRFPACVLYIDMKLGAVDVNVHPAKTEVKFLSDKTVFDSIYYAASGSLHSQSGQSEIRNFTNRYDTSRNEKNPKYIDYTGAGISMGNQKTKNAGLQIDSPKTGYAKAGNKTGGFTVMPADTFRNVYGPRTNNTNEPEQTKSTGRTSDETSGKISDETFAGTSGETAGKISDETFAGISDETNLETSGETAGKTPGGTTSETTCEITQNANLHLPVSTSDFNIIGEALKTYIIAEYNDSIYLIDKHAAHERIHFDALKKAEYEPMPQMLITPVICRLSHEHATLLLTNTELTTRLGFAIESFGDDTVAVREIPSEIEISDVESVLSEICENLTIGSKPLQERIDEIYSQVACKASIKAGKTTDIRELELLASRVLSGEIEYCPHGRPVSILLSKATLDRNFKRT